jgi:hypothetical protein
MDESTLSKSPDFDRIRAWCAGLAKKLGTARP